MNTSPPLVLLKSFGSPLGSFVARELEGSSRGEGKGVAYTLLRWLVDGSEMTQKIDSKKENKYGKNH